MKNVLKGTGDEIWNTNISLGCPQEQTPKQECEIK